MRRALLFVTLFVLCATIKFNDKKLHHKKKFNRFIHKLKHLTKEQFEKFQNNFLADKKDNVETHRQAEIAKKVNRLKTTWKATEYKRDYKPLLGEILEGGTPLPEKQFTQIIYKFTNTSITNRIMM